MSVESDRRLREILEANPGLSDPQVAALAGVGKTTARRARLMLEAAGMLPRAVSRIGADGRVRPVPGTEAADGPVGGGPVVGGDGPVSAEDAEQAWQVIKRASQGGSVSAARMVVREASRAQRSVPIVVPRTEPRGVEVDEAAKRRRALTFARLAERRRRGEPLPAGWRPEGWPEMAS